MSKNDDEVLLVDYLKDALEAPQKEQVKHRLAAEPDLRQLLEDLRNTVAAVGMLPQVQPPSDLVAKTMARIQAARRTDALIAREEAHRGRPGLGTFSYRELGALAASILVLAAIFVPSLRQAKLRMLTSECASNVGQIGTALNTYASENNEYLPMASDQKYQWLPVEGEKVVSNSAGLFKLVKAAQAPPNVFQCPAAASAPLVALPGMTDFPSAQYVCYSYQHPLGPGEGGKLQPLRRNTIAGDDASCMVVLADNSPVFPDGRFHRDQVNAEASENHNRTGQNVLYMNMSVSWANKPTVGVNNNNIFLADGIFDYRGNETPVSRTDTFLLPAYSQP